MAAFVGRENVLVLAVRIGMCVFLCSNKSEILFGFPSKGPVKVQIIKYLNGKKKSV